MNTITLPDSLVAQIRSYEARLKRMETLVMVAGGFAGLFVTYVLLFIADRFVDTPRGLRVLLLAAGAAAAAWFARGWGKNWLWNRRGPAELAKLLGKHFRSLGDRLQGVVELTSATELPPNVSPALCRAAIAQVAQESSRHQFGQAVPVRPARKWALAGGAVGILMLAAFLLVPKAAKNAMARWAAPWANVDRYTFASLESLPKDLYVAHGEPFDLVIGMAADSAWNPASAKARIGRQEPLHSQFDSGKASFQFPGQIGEETLTVRVGDASYDIAVHPLHRPELKSLTAVVDPPDYLQHPQSRVALQSANAEFLEGSWVSFEGKIARELGAAEMQAPGAGKPAALKGDTFATAARLADELAGEVEFHWADSHNIKPAQPYQLKIATARDGEPKVEFKDLEPEMAILNTEVLNLDLAATDDFGVKESWIGWTVRSLAEDRKVLTEGESFREKGNPLLRESVTKMEWSPIWHKIPEDCVVELAAYALDYFPGRKPSASWKHTIWILSPAKHAEKIRDRMDMVLKQLDDRIRDEERQLEENKAIAEKKDELNSEKATEDIKKLESGERQNDDQLQKLAQEMENVMKDALRNKEIPEKTLADWKNLQQKLQQEASPSMQQASQKMQQAANSPQQQQRQQELSKAQEDQQRALDTMREAANKMNKVNENLYARNFYNRLRRAAQQEHGVSDNLKRLAKDTAGLTPSDIKDAQKKEFDGVAAVQDANTQEVEAISNDMGTFVARLPNEKYQAVVKEMEEKKVVGAMAELAGYVRANLGLKSVGQARQWGKQLDVWAEMLQDESQSGAGESGGEIPPEVMELMIALVRAAWQQDNIREQTLALESKKWLSRKHGLNSGTLADRENELADFMEKLYNKTPVEEAKPLISKVQELMLDVGAELLSAKTDAQNTAVQGMIIELLVPPDKKGGKQSQQMSKMQQMMQQMMAKAQKPGRGDQKAPSNMASTGQQGAGAGRKDNARSVEKSSGAAGAGEWPEEFRDQLQSYFQGVEEKK